MENKITKIGRSMKTVDHKHTRALYVCLLLNHAQTKEHLWNRSQAYIHTYIHTYKKHTYIIFTYL